MTDMYLYNGLRFPKLPTYDKNKYLYTFMTCQQIEDKTYGLRLLAYVCVCEKPAIKISTGVAMQENAKYRSYRCANKAENNYRAANGDELISSFDEGFAPYLDERIASGNKMSYPCVWTWHDILDADGNVYMQASAPIHIIDENIQRYGLLIEYPDDAPDFTVLGVDFVHHSDMTPSKEALFAGEIQAGLASSEPPSRIFYMQEHNIIFEDNVLLVVTFNVNGGPVVIAYESGLHTINWNGTDLTLDIPRKGVYFPKLLISTVGNWVKIIWQSWFGTTWTFNEEPKPEDIVAGYLTKIGDKLYDLRNVYSVTISINGEVYTVGTNKLGYDEYGVAQCVMVKDVVIGGDEVYLYSIVTYFADANEGGFPVRAGTYVTFVNLPEEGFDVKTLEVKGLTEIDGDVLTFDGSVDGKDTNDLVKVSDSLYNLDGVTEILYTHSGEFYTVTDLQLKILDNRSTLHYYGQKMVVVVLSDETNYDGTVTTAGTYFYCHLPGYVTRVEFEKTTSRTRMSVCKKFLLSKVFPEDIVRMLYFGV